MEGVCQKFSLFSPPPLLSSPVIITGSRLYININLKQYKSEKNESSRGGGEDQVMMTGGGCNDH